MAHFTIDFYVKALGRKTKVDLVIPSLNLHGALGNKNEKYYQEKKETYPLMICLHGFGDTKEGWQENTPINKLAEDNGFAVAFINGENKWYLNMGPIDDFYSLIERDLPDFLYGNFSFLSSDAPLAIAGVSMGGYGALYHYFKNRDKYTCCIALSPATKPDFIDETKYGTLRELALENKDRNNVYLSVGTKDFIISHSKEFDKFFKENNINIGYKYVDDCDHSWPTWSKEMPSVIEYLRSVNFIK